MDDLAIEPKQPELAQPEPKLPEPAPKQPEVVAKDKEPRASQWTHPLVLSLVAAAAALLGNIVTNILNNRASAEAEHFRAQSNLVLSVIKTNGNEDDACKNLNFMVNIGWLDDAKGAIHNACGTRGGVPTLPAAGSSGPSEQTGSGAVLSETPTLGGSGLGMLFGGSVTTLTVRVEDADSHLPIANAKVDLVQPPLPIPFTQQQNPIFTLQQPKSEPQGPTLVNSTTSGATGDATLNYVSFTNVLTASKEGYESVSKSMSQLGLSGSRSRATVLMDLHRVSASKH